MRNGIIAVVVLALVAGGGWAFHQQQVKQAALEAQLAQIAAEKVKADAEKAKADQIAHDAAVAKAAVEKVQSDAAASVATAKADVIQNPDKWLEVSGERLFDDGIVNTYSRLVSVTITNRSAFAVHVLDATVNYQTSEGHPVGSMPVTFTGNIAAGQAREFSAIPTSFGPEPTLLTNKLQGKSGRVGVHFSRVELL
jgi:hypothetical protein